jgi:anti-anti-sigma factor
VSVESPAAQVLHLPEELCIFEIPAVRQRVDECIDDGARHLVFDLAATRLVTAAALRVIDTTDHRLTSLGGALRLRNPLPLPLRVLQITGFDRLVEPSLAP